MIQNELISVLAKQLFRDIKSELQSAPFIAIILDTTQQKRPVKLNISLRQNRLAQ